MSQSGPLAFSKEFSQLPSDQNERHGELVNFFGQFIFWLRRCSLRASREFINSEETRAKLGTIRRAYYDGAANLLPEQREAAMFLAEETLDGFIERLLWSLGDEGTDARVGSQHAYRFRVDMEIVDVESGETVYEETINRGGKFFGSYWGRWLNRYGKWRDDIDPVSSVDEHKHD
jgi:hypothetical protein